MATPIIETGFVTGEVAPTLFGRVDLSRERIAAATMRNMVVDVRGGAKSRAGTAFVGYSKQTGRQFPPRPIPFQFSINEGRMLEFGNFYVRFVADGAFITETPVAIGGATNANPCVLTIGTTGATVATPNNGAVTFSYAPGDLVTLAGGTFLTPAVLAVTTSELVSLLPNAHGSGYAVNDTVTLGGGTFSAAAVAKVTAVAAYAAAGFITFATNPSDGDTVTLNGVAWTFKTTVSGAAQTAIQGSLAATLVQLASDLNASANASLTPATYGYTDTTLTITYDTTGAGGNAYTLAASVATPSGGTLTGGTTTGISTLSINTAGVYSALPANGNMTQTATSGAGTGASFQTAVFGPHALTISNPGAYTATPANPASQSATTGVGVGATFTMTYAAVAPFATGDWIDVSGVLGMTELNGNTFQIAVLSATTFELFDVWGRPVDATAFGAYTGGGIAERIYTVATPYAEEDLQWLKVTQSADEMTICCVNQDTGVEYQPQNLVRFSDTDWVFTGVVAEASVSAPTGLTATITGKGTTFYRYEVTAISPVDGTESVGSAAAGVSNGVDISSTKGQVNLTWNPVQGVFAYNIYKAQPSYASDVPVGSLLGFIGTTYGVGFADSNIQPDFVQVPPLHKDPFARGQIASVSVVTGGSSYTTATAAITSGTGSGASLQVVVQGGKVVAVIVIDAGSGYQAGDTIAITGTGGSGATATLVIGPETGTYPSVPNYFQERRVFANSLNDPDTYWMSQTGAFGNFDSRVPPIDSDAITGSPWAQQVNGVQFMVPTAGGLLVMTGLTAWLLVGAGSFATNVQAISPTTQDANPQPFTGCSPIIAPVKINYDVVYVTAKGSLYYDLPYQLYTLSEPIDLTQYSVHLFEDFTVLGNAWCEQPLKLLWSVRDDGALLSMTYLKAEQISGWARHDTNGYFWNVCAVTEPPVDAPYFVTERFPNGLSTYMIERLDNRLWTNVEEAWCVDAALALPQPEPNAALTADLPYGIGNLTGVVMVSGGSGYSAETIAQIDDANGLGSGSGAVPVLTIVAGIITNVTFAPQGSGYSSPKITFLDPTGAGRGAEATVLLNTTATFTASSAAFSPGDIGSVIRMGGAVADITGYLSALSVSAKLRNPITTVRRNGSTVTVVPQPAGTWTKTAPVSSVSGLFHLAGMTVTGLADGNPITPRVVSALGVVTLDAPASAITIGLAFTAQVQSVYADTGSPTTQGQRKKTAAVSALMNASRGVQMGSNQTDGSTLNPIQIDPQWNAMKDVPDLVKPAYNSATAPLYTGWVRVPVGGGFNKTGQAALQQVNPLPMELLAFVPELLPGDTPSMGAQQQ